MPEDKVVKAEFQDPASNNADVAAKLAAQDINIKGSVSSAEDQTHTFDALDKLAQQQHDEKEAAAVVDPAAKPVVDPVKPVEGDEAAKAAAAAAAAAAAEKEAADKAAGKGMFDDVSLPPNVRPKSAEAFATIKERAAAAISERDKKISDLESQVMERDEKLKNPVPEEINRELTELREWRTKMDVEVDPQFKEFTASITKTEDFIYAQLKKSPAITDDTIAQIKKLGGPANVNLAKIFEAVKDSTIQRLVESKVADIEVAKFNREQAIKSAKENVGQYLKDREAAFVASSTSHNAETEKHVGELFGKLSWTNAMVAPKDAKPEEIAEIEAHNKFAEETRAAVKQALLDDSPKMRAIMLVGMAQLLNYQRQYEAQSDKLAKVEKAFSEVNGKLEKVKASSTSRLRDGGAEHDSRLPAPSKASDKDIFNTDPGSALDALARQQQEDRAKAAQ